MPGNMSCAGKSRFPPIANRVEAAFIDATPDGNYALRILRYYRATCDEKWEVHGLSEDERRIYDLMNEHQDQRAEELDEAIAVLEGRVQNERLGG